MNWPEFYEAYRLLDDQSTIVCLIKVKKTKKMRIIVFFYYKVGNRLTIPSLSSMYVLNEGLELFEKSRK